MKGWHSTLSGEDLVEIARTIYQLRHFLMFTARTHDIAFADYVGVMNLVAYSAAGLHIMFTLSFPSPTSEPKWEATLSEENSGQAFRVSCKNIDGYCWKDTAQLVAYELASSLLDKKPAGYEISEPSGTTAGPSRCIPALLWRFTCPNKR